MLSFSQHERVQVQSDNSNIIYRLARWLLLRRLSPNGCASAEALLGPCLHLGRLPLPDQLLGLRPCQQEEALHCVAQLVLGAVAEIIQDKGGSMLRLSDQYPSAEVGLFVSLPCFFFQNKLVSFFKTNGQFTTKA